jgi:AraC-like DNA-binding protein
MDFYFSLIPLTLYTICLLSFLTFYVGYKIQKAEAFGRVLLFLLIYIFLHSSSALVVEIFYPHEKWRVQLAPFILLYGPLLYFGIVALKQQQLQVWKLLPHAAPFLGYFLIFLCLYVGAVKFTPALEESISKQLYTIGPVSFIIYTTASFIGGRKLFASTYRNYLLLFVFARVALLFLGMLFLIMFFSGPISIHPDAMLLLRMIAYACMLIFVALIFNFTVNKLLNRFSKNDYTTRTLERERADARYEKSPLSNGQLEIYQDKLNHLMEKQKVFLDTNLSLTSLAQLLKIPNHHLSQVFSVQFNQTFYQYINSFRIDYACIILAENTEINLEELAEKSGFNSKPSFNRQFKFVKGCTPSEYRNKNKRQSIDLK